WYENTYVLADRIYNQPDMPYVFDQDASSSVSTYQNRGSLSDWQEQISRYAIGNSFMVLAISFGFVAPLLKLIGMDNFGLHIYGSSSTGKTTLASVIASIWSDQHFIKKWRTTTNGLEAQALLHNDGLLILDELAQVNSYEVDKISYMLGNGAGKARANRKGKSRKVETFRLGYFSTGELSIVEKIKESGKRAPAGVQMRFIDLNVNQVYGVFDELHGFKNGGELSNYLKEQAQKYYGTAINAFLTELVKDLDYWKAEVATYINEFIAEFKDENLPGQAQRVLKSFALIAAAGQIATMMGVTGWSDTKGSAGRCDAYCMTLQVYNQWLEEFG
ncbi:DUF927 domain-containing protein, partial [Thiotrichales bacterium 19S9-12]|nr:DUF927 domain-containing protein [Thiotrichales bacterium 19S9-12]